jgi:hypothetical protein
MNCARPWLAAITFRRFPRISFESSAATRAPKLYPVRLHSLAALAGRCITRGFAVRIPKGDISADLTEIVPDLGHHWKQLEKPADKHASPSKPQKELPPPPTLLAFDDLREVRPPYRSLLTVSLFIPSTSHPL